jgi:anti-anti-sigma factor
MDDALDIQIRREESRAIVTITGDIDIHSVAQLREQLFELAARGRQLEVDLDGVNSIDAAGLGALFATFKRAAAHGGGLHVVCARDDLLQLFHETGLDRQIPLN